MIAAGRGDVAFCSEYLLLLTQVFYSSNVCGVFEHESTYMLEYHVTRSHV